MCVKAGNKMTRTNIFCGERILKARKEAGLTQMEVASRMGYGRDSATTICRWEKDEVAPSKENMKKLASALGKSVYDLFPEVFVKEPMTLNEYQQAAQRTSNTYLFSSKIENGLLGLCGEVGELADHYKKYRYQEHEFDKQHMIREAGDVLWYLAELARGLDCTLEDIAQANIDKLLARYPNGFHPDKSKHRKAGDD